VPNGSLNEIYSWLEISTTLNDSTYLYVIDVVSIPGGTEKLVTKSQDKNVLDHLLAKVVVNSENLVFGPVRAKCSLELSGATKIFPEGLLDLPRRLDVPKCKCCYGTHNDTRDAVLRITIALQVLRDGNENARRKCHVKDPVRFLATLLKLFDVFPQVDERVILIVLTGDVGAETTEFL
jgi:hypothetical protein